MPRPTALLVLLAGLLASPAAAIGATPTTRFVQNAPIEAFAQDGGRIAWVGGRCHKVRIRTLSDRRQEMVGSATSGFRGNPVAALVAGMGPSAECSVPRLK